MLDFRNQRLLHALEGGRPVHGEADEEDGSVWVAERSQSVVVLPPTCVPEPKIVAFSGNWHWHRDIVVKNGGDISILKILNRRGIHRNNKLWAKKFCQLLHHQWPRTWLDSSSGSYCPGFERNLYWHLSQPYQLAAESGNVIADNTTAYTVHL